MHWECSPSIKEAQNRGKRQIVFPKTRLFLLAPLFLVFSIPSVYAEDVDLSQIPNNLAEKTGIPLFAGQLLCSAIILFMFLLPLTILTRKRGSSWLAELIVGFIILGVCIALGWLPYWIMLVICLIVAGMYASKMKNVFGK